MLNGTGIRDAVEGGYISPEKIGLSGATTDKITDWLSKYEAEHYNGYADVENIDSLDHEGLVIADQIRKEIKGAKVDYFSSAKMVTLAED